MFTLQFSPHCLVQRFLPYRSNINAACTSATNEKIARSSHSFVCRFICSHICITSGIDKSIIVTQRTMMTMHQMKHLKCELHCLMKGCIIDSDEATFDDLTRFSICRYVKPFHPNKFRKFDYFLSLKGKKHHIDNIFSLIFITSMRLFSFIRYDISKHVKVSSNSCQKEKREKRTSIFFL